MSQTLVLISLLGSARKTFTPTRTNERKTERENQRTRWGGRIVGNIHSPFDLMTLSGKRDG